MQDDSRKTSAFPAPIYLDTVLKHIFHDAKLYLLQPLIEIEYAHTLMLARQHILPVHEAAKCLRALAAINPAEIQNTPYDGAYEDLFFLVEDRLATACGAD